MNKRILALIAVHVVAFVGTSRVAFGHNGPDVPSTLFLALVFAETGALGLWAALGKGRWSVRLACVMGVLFAIWGVTVAAQPHRPNLTDMVGIWLLFGLPCAIIAIVLAHRRRRRNLALRRTSETISHEGFQFSIKHLLFGTASVAIVLSVGRVMRTWQPDANWAQMIMVVVVVAPSLVVVELATFWAALGLGRPLLRLSTVVPSAFVTGLVPPFCLEQHGRTGTFLLWSSMIGASAVVLAATLLVVRSAGWRLCSLDEGTECCKAIGALNAVRDGQRDEEEPQRGLK